MSEHESTDGLPGLVQTAVQQLVPVVEQVQLARNTYRLRLQCPEIAEQILPGQFFMIRQPDETDPLLGRPFALYDTYQQHGRPAGVDFVYIVVGKLTARMSRWKAGDRAEIWGPLGNGFPLPQPKRLMMVAGGIGQTPFLAVAREALGLRSYGRPPRQLTERLAQVTLCYGVRSADSLAGLDEFESLGIEVRIATDDGTRGRRGFVTDLLTSAVDAGDPPDSVFCCGPEPMMHRVQQICAEQALPCWLSLESPMACGFGACFSCVVRVRMDDGSWDYRRSCVEGPVFPAEQLIL